ncbi:MAG: 3-alpha,7-alpha,12-alpha-trihydroxy-5-beta-cholest-24-enoyl-CoA hydratase [Actinobacteria bacterium]|jgi:3-hydroxyacyl-CoA dehydrogenase/3a,7a,12a-trihydroxy-5b-cholest-24-enoyl-CoA hydratase|nr:MAG: 3-alpha,7-alpha,12-alpha-trihydroxy-5-beta-cholest-24-enoyl-CoA hydratase [Actinomycetota bacterium]
MPIDPAIVGAEPKPVAFKFEERDTILYALGVGAGADAADLKFTTESNLTALPTFGVIPPFKALMGLLEVPGLDINLVMLLHGEQYLEIKKDPLPVKGSLISKPKIAALYDKGKGALVELDVETVDEDDEPVFFNKFSLFIRGEGGFGGERGPEPGNEPPAREPDKVVEIKTLPQQALIYRLSGDLNPLHSDPAIATMAGYDRPILHGLCTFGVAGKAVLQAYCDNDPTLFRAMKVRFSRHVFPGETIVTEMWQTAPDTVIIRCKAAERDEYCLTNSAVWINA